MQPNKQIKHRRAIKKFFVTFPQSSGISKELFFHDIADKFKTTSAICAQEEHLDGKPHLHLAIEFEDFATKFQILQHLKDIYPDDYKRIDVQSMRSMKHSITYLTEPDKDKKVDLCPFLYNCTISEESSNKHYFFTQNFKDEHPTFWAEACGCTQCLTLIKLTNSNFRKMEDALEAEEQFLKTLETD